MSVGKRELETRLDAEKLAKALRSGLELRWSIPSPPLGAPGLFPPLGNVRPFLEPYADSLNFAAPRRRHLLLHGLRAIRFTLRKLLGPWMQHQTFFNLSAVSVLEQVEQRVKSLEETERSLRQSIETLEKSFLSRTQGPSCEQIDSRFSPPPADIDERILEPIFIHTHLPRPPARLLVLGCEESTNALAMASLGFEVVGVAPRPLPLNHPNFTMIQANLADLPFDDESFDAAIALSTLGHGPSDEQAAAEIFRVLRRSGRFLVTAPYRARLDCFPNAFRVVERGYGVREGNA
jgi:hypothetical protein